jgi:hypothetical protein
MPHYKPVLSKKHRSPICQELSTNQDSFTQFNDYELMPSYQQQETLVKAGIAELCVGYPRTKKQAKYVPHLRVKIHS